MNSEQFNKLLANPVLLNKDTFADLKLLVEKHPSFQVAWFLYLKNLKQIKSSDFDTVLKKVAVQVSDRKLLYKFLNTNFHKKHSIIELESTDTRDYKLGNESDTKTGDSLIDKFLSAKPGVIRQNAGDAEKISNPRIIEVEENSTAENSGIVTETLATIYFQQKNYEKAQETYKKLSLKYPEKSVYFATRIKEIEKLKNI